MAKNNVFKKMSTLGLGFVRQITDAFIRQGAWPENIHVSAMEDMPGPKVSFNNKTIYANCSTNLFKKFKEEADKKLSEKEKSYNKVDSIKETSTCKAIRNHIINRGFASIFLKNHLNLFYNPDSETRELVGDIFIDKVKTSIAEVLTDHTILAKLKSDIHNIIDHGEFLWVIKDVDADISDKEEIKKYELNTDYDCRYLIPCFYNDNLEFGIYKHVEGSSVSAEINKKNHGVNVLDNVPKVELQNTINKIKDLTQIQDSEYEIIPADRMIYFTLSKDLVKLDISEVFDEEFCKQYYNETKKNLPRFSKLSEGLYEIAYDDIQNLEILKALQKGALNGQALSSKFFTMNFPAKTPQVRVTEGLVRAEEKLNDFSHAQDIDIMDINSLVNATQHRAVIAEYSDGKGGLKPVDLGFGEEYDKLQKKIEDTKGSIAALTSMDPLIFGATNIPTDKNYYRFDAKFSAIVNLICAALLEGLSDMAVKMLELEHGLSVQQNFIKLEVKEIAISETLNFTDTVTSITSAIQDILKTQDFLKDTGIQQEKSKLISMLNYLNNTIAPEPDMYCEEITEDEDENKNKTPKYKPHIESDTIDGI